MTLKLIFNQFNIPTPAFEVYTDISAINFETIDMPVVVKPIVEGSSIGMSIVKERDKLKIAAEEAFKYDRRIMFEKYISGREVTVAVIEKDGKIEALPIIEIKHNNAFFDFEAKYTKGKTEYIVPAQIEETLAKKIKDTAVEAFKALNCKDFSRIDIMIDGSGKLYVLEINTIPGMTETSLLPKAAASAGIPFEDLIEMFVVNNL